ARFLERAVGGAYPIPAATLELIGNCKSIQRAGHRDPIAGLRICDRELVGGARCELRRGRVLDGLRSLGKIGRRQRDLGLIARTTSKALLSGARGAAGTDARLLTESVWSQFSCEIDRPARRQCARRKQCCEASP